ncbi:biogenesis of lysosome-related organelles complex 1 subunit 6-like isoform X2 [Zootermopsis nevadensis]|uniref:biogenesis of lysosome-related organelles complex 1 subunit 6-like isoform X2 n=1 Tax=Zootermopsis nevadensis TaxID=136037 RepID=UPI000B8E692C|nr:biogenesis of lysosome-related organelles complex 1 subunit 6-like isoform X2 [Zootermopsis nevadensis]
MTDNPTQACAFVPQESSSDGKKQTSLIDKLQDENRRFNNVQTSEELQQMFTTVKLYQTKLVTIKKEMMQLYDRATKLKTRALKLQQTKQKAALHRQQQRELQLQRETDLIAKPSSSCGEKGKSS